MDFVCNKNVDQPYIFEVFTKDYDDRAAFDFMSSIEADISSSAKQVAKQLLGKKGTDFVKKIIKR